MSAKRKLVIVITEGLDNERASVAWSIANGGIKSGLEVHVFLTSSAIDWVRKGAADHVHLNPKDPPMIEMIQFVRDNGCPIYVCPPCAAVRGYSQEDLLDGVIITGSGAIHKQFIEGAAALTF
ncbi:DsrE family protein [Robiginitalea sp. SC105]|uniref:DsrE family protein n=1 Tax=Robiginitalea sp. SC105 TaxID=2762332 RepID=UPI00163AF1C9|nr:DsrE family protein [Robiginitalea sp. SC105]MBC2840418.1 DsrE family protein [Robiginitalea sp. SC105]